jgi:predicted SAM-dependent methyltransferase
MAPADRPRPLPVRVIRAILRRSRDAVADLLTRARRLQTRRGLSRFDKLHLGSGGRLLGGWANLDINGLGSLVWDLRKPLPIRSGAVRFVYTEHFIEHIRREDADRLFRHALRVMAPGGIVRVSTPDLEKLMEDYRTGRLVRMEHGGWFPETPCRMVNEAMHLWGHVFLYDEPELRGLLEECGFSDVHRVGWGESEHSELAGLESRPDFGDLILEGRA